MMRYAMAVPLLPALALFAWPAGVTVSTIDGNELQVAEFTISEPDLLSYRAIDGREGCLPCDEIVRIDFGARSERILPQLRIVLARKELVRGVIDGDVILGNLVRGDDNGLVVSSPDLGEVEVSYESMRRLVMLENPRVDMSGLQSGEEADFVYLVNGDFDRGWFLSITPQEVAIESKIYEEVRRYPLAKVAGVEILPLEEAPQEPSTLVAIVRCGGGSTVMGRIVSFDGSVLIVEALYGTRYAIAARSLALIYFKNGRVVYLSDRLPVLDWHPPGISFSEGKPYEVDRPYQFDRDAPQTITLRRQQYRKGLGVHAVSLLLFELNGEYEKFLAVVGVDDSARPCERATGTVEFEVWANDRPLEEWMCAPPQQPPPDETLSSDENNERYAAWVEAYDEWWQKMQQSFGRSGRRLKTGVLSTKDEPRPIEVDMKGVKRLGLFVNNGGDDETRDRAVWADARLIR